MISVSLGIGQMKIENKDHYCQRRYNFHKGRRKERERDREREEGRKADRKRKRRKEKTW